MMMLSLCTWKVFSLQPQDLQVSVSIQHRMCFWFYRSKLSFLLLCSRTNDNLQRTENLLSGFPVQCRDYLTASVFQFHGCSRTFRSNNEPVSVERRSIAAVCYPFTGNTVPLNKRFPSRRYALQVEVPEQLLHENADVLHLFRLGLAVLQA